ncbi:MAG: hypothetical protein HXX13_16470 [Bacteroidetes bacterium]|nr:hypothetical protein [Bacteroidota bacterium]
MRLLYTIFTSLLLFLTLTVSAQQVNNFDELMVQLKAGKKVHAVFQYAKFKLISDNEEQEKVPDAVGGMDLSTWEYFAPNSVKNKDAFIVFSDSKLIKNPKGDGFVYDYVKVKISSDNKVKVTAEYLDASTYAEKMDENFFGVVNDGKNEGGLLLYISQ